MRLKSMDKACSTARTLRCGMHLPMVWSNCPVLQLMLTSRPLRAASTAACATFSGFSKKKRLKKDGVPPARSKNPVAIGFGQTLTTCVPLRFSSALRAREKECTKDLLAAYTAKFGCGRKAATDAIS